jgi:hypothetical protein
MDVARSMHPLESGGGRVGWEPLPCLHVAPTARGTWRVSASRHGPGTEHPDREAALVAARRGCRRQWEATGEPCALRLYGRDGTTTILPGDRFLG